MFNHRIKNIYTDATIFECKCDSMKNCVEAAVKMGQDLRGADL